VELLERYANEQWLPGHMTPQQAAASVLDSFKRAAAGVSAGSPIKHEWCWRLLFHRRLKSGLE
jgi:hypothetical protein